MAKTKKSNEKLLQKGLKCPYYSKITPSKIQSNTSTP